MRHLIVRWIDEAALDGVAGTEFGSEVEAWKPRWTGVTCGCPGSRSGRSARPQR